MKKTDDLLPSPPLRGLAADDPRFSAIVGVSFDAYDAWDIRTGDNNFSQHFDWSLGQPVGSARRWFYAWLELVCRHVTRCTAAAKSAASRSTGMALGAAPSY